MMYKDSVTVLHVEYPLIRNESSDHVLLTALSVMFRDFQSNTKFHTMTPAEHHQIIQLFEKITGVLIKGVNQEDDYGVSNTMSSTMNTIGHKMRVQSVMSSLEKLFYETEYQVIITIAPLKTLSLSERESLEQLEYLQRFNKTRQQIRDEKIHGLLGE